MIDAIKKALDEQKRSGAWLAGEIGVSRMSMSRWLREVEPLPEDRAKQIADKLGIAYERSQGGEAAS